MLAAPQSGLEDGRNLPVCGGAAPDPMGKAFLGFDDYWAPLN